MHTKLLSFAVLSLLLMTAFKAISLFAGEATSISQSSLVADNQILIDERTTQKVMAAFARDEKTANAGINVITENGVVTLSGSVNNVKLKNELESKAKNASGVKRVISLLEVKSMPQYKNY